MVDLDASLEARTLEEKCLNAWPPARRALLDGWLLGFTEGFTRRANCVNVLYRGALGLDQKVDACEAAYASHGLAAIFKMTPVAMAQDLEIVLSARGYDKEATSLVQVRRLSGADRPAVGATFRATPDPEWMALYARMKQMDAREAALTEAMLRQIPATALLTTITDRGRPVAAGIGVKDGKHLGLFGLVTDPERRREGFGTRLVKALLHQGQEMGASTAYLQVETGNDGALRLYDRLGFRTAYSYWYRVKEPAGRAR